MEGCLLWAGQACWHGWSAASSAMTLASSLQPSCRQSVAHALLTCGGATPAYFTKGFAPLGFLGALASKKVERFATRAWQLPAPPVALGQAGDAAQRVRAGAAAELLRCVAMGGAKELATAAEAAGLPPAGLLDTLLGDLLQAAPCATTKPQRPQPRNGRSAPACATRETAPISAVNNKHMSHGLV